MGTFLISAAAGSVAEDYGNFYYCSCVLNKPIHKPHFANWLRYISVENSVLIYRAEYECLIVNAIIKIPASKLEAVDT